MIRFRNIALTERAQSKTVALSATLALLLAASPAFARPAVQTRLVDCGAGSCLQITGSRTDQAARVLVNGVPVTVAGDRRWKALLPVDTLRTMSAPFARTVSVSVEGPSGAGEIEHRVPLPIGLLGGTTDLALLEIGA